MPKSIPPGITRDHVLLAASDIDAGLGREFGPHTGYEAIVNNKAYAPKALVGVAAGHAFGQPLGPADFSGGEAPGQANHYLRNLGLRIERLGPAGERWSDDEIQRVITVYMGMVRAHIAGKAPSVSSEAEALDRELGRTNSSTFAIRNVSAALRDLGFPFLIAADPKDRPGQKHLREILKQRLEDHPDEAALVRSLLVPRAPKLPGNRLAVGQQYSRAMLRELAGLPGKGGDFDTGYTELGGEFIIFSTLGEARTGHNYGNRWLSDSEFAWYGKNGTTVWQPRIQAMVSGRTPVHLFTREHDRAMFTYHGLARATQTFDETPVKVHWGVQAVTDDLTSPDEVPATLVREGAVRQITVNAYERSRKAKAACVKHWGTGCYCCGLKMEDRYGEIAEGFIHAHHLNPVASIGREYTLDPVKDLRPVCPNCHAIIHLKTPAMKVDELRDLLSGRQ